MYLRETKKNVKYVADEESDDVDDSPTSRKFISNNNNNTPKIATPKRKLSDDALVVVKKEKTSKSSPQLQKIEPTDLEISYGKLEKAEKNRSDRRQKWSDEEHSLILFAIYRNYDGNKLVSLWPNDEYPRSPAVIKKRMADVKVELKATLQIEQVNSSPESDGIPL